MGFQKRLANGGFVPLDPSDTKGMFDVVRGSISKGLRIVNIRSKEAYDTLKIKNKIRELNTKRRNAVLDMGNSIYRSYKHKGQISVDVAREKCEGIERIDAEIVSCEEELDLIHSNAQKALGSLKALSSPDNGPEKTKTE